MKKEYTITLQCDLNFCLEKNLFVVGCSDFYFFVYLFIFKFFNNDCILLLKSGKNNWKRKEWLITKLWAARRSQNNLYWYFSHLALKQII